MEEVSGTCQDQHLMIVITLDSSRKTHSIAPNLTHLTLRQRYVAAQSWLISHVSV